MAWLPVQMLAASSVQFSEFVLKQYWISLLKEDKRVIGLGGGHKITLAKQSLQVLENCINKAINRVPSQDLCVWISDAQKVAFCLEDQIDMYAIHGSNSDKHLEQLSAMKSAIGMFSVDKLMNNIQDLINNRPDLDEVQSSAILPSHHNSEDTETFGIDDKIEELKGELLSDADSVIFVRGEQLSGKTTLMNKVYKDIGVENHFNVRSKVSMSKTRCLADLLRAVLKYEGHEANSMDPDGVDELKIIEEIHRKLHIQGNRYLVVMDDVEDTSSLYVLRHVLRDCKGKIVCLTSIKDMEYEGGVVAKVEVLPLKPDDQEKLLVHVAFRSADVVVDSSSSSSNNGGQQEGGEGGECLLGAALRQKADRGQVELAPMVETLKGILKKCRGNPWNIRTVGALLAANDIEQWKEIGEHQVDAVVITGDKKRDPLIQAEDAQLPADIRLGFLYCLAFPERSEIAENSGIPARKLVRLWTAEGFPPHESPRQSQEQEAEQLLQKLIDKKLLVVEKRALDGEVLKCRVNKHMRQLARNICEQQKFCRFMPDSAQPRAPPPRPKSSLFRRNRALVHRYRVLAVHGDGDENEAVQDMSSTMRKDIRLRSLLYFRTERKEPPKLELSFGRTYKLLRTLELQGTRLARLHYSITCLVCLHYLGLRGTQLEFLPATLWRLRRLMCLDIRDTGITEVNDVSEFKEMRHLYLANSFRDRSVLIKEGLPSLLHLQTLSGVAVAHQVPSERRSLDMIPLEQELLYLKLLRKLSIKKVSSTCCKDICDAINGMEFLQSLTITRVEGGEGQFDISSLKINNNLRKLKLGGDMGQFFLLEPRMQSITYLYLWDSKLPQDPLYHLRGLQHLLLLSLCNAYTGEMMNSGNGYRKLKKLSIISMENVNACIFGQGSMRNLAELVFARCDKLMSTPEGLGHLDSLREVHQAQMPEQFCRETKDCLSNKDVRVLEFQLHFHASSRATV